MPLKKHKKGRHDATSLSVRMEMGKPRMARSARIRELELDTTRLREEPSTVMPGTVEKIIPSPSASKPEKAEIAVDRTDHRHRKLRIKNELIDEHGDDVKLKKGARVEVKVTAEPKASIAASDEDSKPARRKKAKRGGRRRKS